MFVVSDASYHVESKGKEARWQLSLTTQQGVIFDDDEREMNDDRFLLQLFFVVVC